MNKCVGMSSALLLLGAIVLCSPVRARDIEYRMAVLAMRHGIRHPTPAPPDLQLYAQNRQWSSWYTTQLGCLTSNGVRVEERLGEYYRHVLVSRGLISGGTECPVDRSYYIRADSFQRTWWSARGMADGLYPGCSAKIYAIDGDTYAQEVPKPTGDLTCTSANDPLFFPLQSGGNAPQMNPQQALLAAAATIGSHGDANTVTTEHLSASFRSQISVMQSATDCCQPAACPNLPLGQKCSLGVLEDTLTANGQDIDLNGPVTIGGILSATFLMAYQDGLPMEDVAFGRLNLEELNPTYELNNAAFNVMYNTPYAARAQMSNWMNQILLALQQRAEDTKKVNAVALPSNQVVLFMGHDDNLHGLGSLMQVSWINEGYQPYQTPAGSGFVFTLIRDRKTRKHFVRVEFVAQTPLQQRRIEPLSFDRPPSIAPLQIPGCESPPDLPYYCPLDRFNKLIRKSMSPEFITRVPSLR